MYNADSISAQSKLKEAEKQEEKQIGKSVKQEDKQTPRSPDSTSNVKFEEKHVRRSSVKKIEKMKEKVLPQCCYCLCGVLEEQPKLPRELEFPPLGRSHADLGFCTSFKHFIWA